MDKNPLLEKAYNFAQISLAGKKRYSGELFLGHCQKVVDILQGYRVNDPTTLAVAILHHSLSDGAATLNDISKEFGEEISLMVKTLDNLRIIHLNDTSEEVFVENLRKMFLVMARDLRIVLIKLADILDNLRTLEFLPREKQIEVAKETIEIFAPLAERLGMGEMKGIMQDLAFKHLYPQDFEKTKKLLKLSLNKQEKMLLKIQGQLKVSLEKEAVSYRVESRAKHLYSLYTKLNRPEINGDMSRVHDLIAFRIIVLTVEDCYKVLDIVQLLWKQMPDKVRDFIAYPKPNGYQSIHTTVFGSSDQPFEIQIRTEKMHQEAEYGLAAHWHYSEVKSKGASDEDLTLGVSADTDKLQWVKQLSSWQEEIIDNEEFLKSVKTDFFGSRIFVFTPKGDVKDLPKGSTPVDFAYRVHTSLGDKVMGAKVNGKMVSLNYQLSNGDVVEVILSKEKSKKPSRDWLKFVVTSEAKRRIKKLIFYEFLDYQKN